MEFKLLKKNFISLLLISLSIISYSNSEIITGIEFIGNTIHGYEELKLYIESDVGNQFDGEILQQDINNIYKTGFFADVGADTEYFSGGVKIIFELIENETVEAVQFEGNNEFDSFVFKNFIKLQSGTIFNFNHLKKDIESIEEFYASNGFVRSRVRDVEVKKGGQIIQIEITEPVIDKISFKGNTQNDSSYLKRVLNVEEKKHFNYFTIRKGLENLQNTGLFEGVDFTVDEGENFKYLNIEINVEEKKTGQLAIGLNYGSYNGFVFFMEVEKKNFRGSGENLSFELKAGQVKNYSFNYRKPYVFRTDYDLDIELFNKNILREQFDASGNKQIEYDEKNTGFGIKFSKKDINSKYSLEYINENLDYEIANSIFNERKEWLKYSKSIQNRDSLVIGGVSLTGYSFLSGNQEYAKFNLSYQKKNKNQKDNNILAWRLKTEFVNKDSDTLFEHEKLKLGGGDSLRGYKYSHFTSNRYFLGNLEYRLEINSQIRYILFSDIAFIESDFKKTIGFGLAFNTPAGIIRLDYGRPIGDNLNETGRIYLGTGYMF
ncbi:MAG: BamA/OMP85 family outer membrane protein [Candidatus Muiribacteriota bacterium]